MTSNDTIKSIMDGMTPDELDELTEILNLFRMCKGKDRKLFMYATRSFLRDKFFATFIDAEGKN